MTLYVIFGAVFLVGAVAYWVATRMFAKEDGVYLPSSDPQQEA